jgi:protein-S-isoprenylcysteine O-methyltransferase Ste14
MGEPPILRYDRRPLMDAITKFLPRDWPCLIVGLILLAYWFRVTRMAIKMRRKTGRAANFIPTEPLGKILRIIWQPVVWAWIGLPLAAAFKAQSHSPDYPLFHSQIVQWIGVAIAAFAYIATRVCWKRMGRSWRMGIDPNEKTALIFTGAYAYVRHPIYALSTLLMIATVMILPTPVMIGVAAIHLLLLQWEARREERNLSRIHGSKYDLYRAKVGGFIPLSLHRYSPRSSV